VTEKQVDLLALFVAMGAVALVIGLFALYDKGEEDCAAAGGELKRYGRATLCVSSDGRILDTEG
jgi:hypothetical protein